MRWQVKPKGSKLSRKLCLFQVNVYPYYEQQSIESLYNITKYENSQTAQKNEFSTQYEMIDFFIKKIFIFNQKGWIHSFIFQPKKVHFLTKGDSTKKDEFSTKTKDQFFNQGLSD